MGSVLFCIGLIFMGRVVWVPSWSPERQVVPVKRLLHIRLFSSVVCLVGPCLAA